MEITECVAPVAAGTRLTPLATPGRRITQRAPQSCVFCARRKLRCSKTIPCSNCTERGTEAQCHREPVVLSRRSAVRQQQTTSHPRDHGRRHRRRQLSSVEPVQLTSRTSASPVVLPTTPFPDPTPDPTPNVATDLSVNTSMDDGPTIVAPVSHTEQMATIETQTQAAVESETHQTDLAVEAAMSLECLAWGAHQQEHRPRASFRHAYRYSYQPRQADRIDSGYSGSDEDSNSGQALHRPLLAATPARGLLGELDLLLTPQQTRAILHFHKLHVAWMHNVVYMPFFVRECEAVLAAVSSSANIQHDSAWFSLYCAILCTGVYYMSESGHRQIGLDEGFAVARALYQLTVEAITASDFMVVQSIYSLQAICVLVLVAHAFGDTRRMKVLLACANTIGQNLGHRLHLMGGPSDDTNKSEPTISLDDAVDHEVRKRIWCFLCTQDWYLIASKKAYSIVPEHNTTPVPANCREDFEDVVVEENNAKPMQDRPLSVQTQSTYMIFLYRLTSIYRGLFDRLSAVHARTNNKANVVSDSFDHVLAADSRLEAAMGEIEDVSRGSSSAAQWRALVITSWHQRVMIHRTFFCRSFQDKRYHYSRFVCLAAARKILRSYLETTSAVVTEIWSIPTHAISGCIILTLHALFTTEKYTLEKSDVDLVQGCLAVLRARPRPNSIVDRGIRIIQHLLKNTTLTATEPASAQKRSYRRLDPNEISQLARDIDIDAGRDTSGEKETSPPTHPVLQSKQTGPPMSTVPTTSPTMVMPMGRNHNHGHTRNHSSHKQPDFAQALLNSQLDAFQPRDSGSVGGDDELFMPWWFDSMLNGYGI
ncbi:hypothetical protein SEUCBS140593_009449 [Sporothrix eucalyptigena]|uniref:Zn(2)-C6 fungal-type domain-containing protein n=1 Tax=Sporothrix eucalyptigena TaxID=1812306 RepID=A0ABP0CXN8_9PEZI